MVDSFLIAACVVKGTSVEWREGGNFKENNVGRLRGVNIRIMMSV